MNKLMNVSYSFITTLCPMSKLTIISKSFITNLYSMNKLMTISKSFITNLCVGPLDCSKNPTGVHESSGRERVVVVFVSHHPGVFTVLWDSNEDIKKITKPIQHSRNLKNRRRPQKSPHIFVFL